MAKKEALPVEEKEVVKKEPLFSKESVLASDRYRDKKDVINALWTDDKERSLSEIDAMIDKFMKGQVK